MAVRPDAKNVNNWHWVEKNAEPWSRESLKELLIDQQIEKGPITVILKEFKKLEGDATANNRKAKLIFLYEWTIEVSFIAKVAGSELEYKGVLEILNLSDENEAHEIDINVTLETRGPQEAEIRHVLGSVGLEFVRTQMGTYIKKLKEEFSKGLILQTDKAQVVTKSGKAGGFDKRSFQNEVVTGSEADKKKVPEKVDVTSFEISESFKVTPARLYEILTSQGLIGAWAGNASIDPKVGGKFSLFGGQITGSFTDLKEGKEIGTQWRLKDYPAEHYGQITFSLRDQGDSTVLSIKGENIPSRDQEKTQSGIHRHYILNIGQKFGISSRLF
jgi:activator of HSP90 ATPase